MTVENAFDSQVRAAQDFALTRLSGATARLAENAWPSVTGTDGRWNTTGPDAWTSGFLPGSLWLAYQQSGDPRWSDLARRWQAGLAGQAANRTTHDLGFMLFDSFGNGYRLTRDAQMRPVLLDAAASLAGRYSPVVGAIRSWDSDPSQFQVIVDGVMNLELLLWASRNGGDPSWREIAITHALTTARDHVRPDASTFHRVIYDPQTGAVIARGTVQGAADSSTWARGQAWAIHGFTMVYRETRDQRFLDVAPRLAAWWLDHVPADGVPYWDFDAPGVPNAPRDTSAAAIAASGLLELARLEPDAARAQRYLAAARKALGSLAASPYLSNGTGSESVLLHGTADAPHGSADTGLIYGDYFFQEALLRLRRIAPGTPALPVAAVTASTDDGNAATNVTDGDLGTRWSAQGDGEWLVADLGRLRRVTSVSVAVHRGDERAARFDLEASSDGCTWVPLAHAVSSGSTRALETYDVPDTSARYVRLVGRGATGTDWNAFTELTVH